MSTYNASGMSSPVVAAVAVVAQPGALVAPAVVVAAPAAFWGKVALVVAVAPVVQLVAALGLQVLAALVPKVVSQRAAALAV